MQKSNKSHGWLFIYYSPTGRCSTRRPMWKIGQIVQDALTNLAGDLAASYAGFTQSHHLLDRLIRIRLPQERNDSSEKRKARVLP